MPSSPVAHMGQYLGSVYGINLFEISSLSHTRLPVQKGEETANQLQWVILPSTVFLL